MEELRKIIQEILQETFKSDHYKERVVQRFKSYKYTEPQFDFSTIEKQLEFISDKINFKPKESFGVFIKSFDPTYYISKDPITKNISEGTDVWVLIRNNEIQTAMFRKKTQRTKSISNIKFITSYKRLVKLYNEGVTEISGLSLQVKSTGSRKKIDLDLPIVTLQGRKWYIDESNEQIIYTKNTKKTISFDKAFDVYPEQEVKKLYDPTSWEK